MRSDSAILEATIDLLGQLVAFDTESSKSNLPLIEAVKAFCATQGAALRLAPNSTGDKAALIATIGPMVDGGLVLSGHTDVVPVKGQPWTSDPFAMRRDRDRLYGRGTCDMKGFDALALAMIPEIAEARLPVPVHILLSYDEEVTCLGSMDIIAAFGRDLPRPRAVLVGEPTNWQVGDSHKSVCTYLTRIEGVEAHSAKPMLGADANAAGCAIAAELARFGRAAEREPDQSGRFDPPYSTVHVGMIEGGTARNILARQCDLHWEFRGMPEAPLDTAQRHVEHFCRDTALPDLNRFVGGGRITTTVEVEVPGLRAASGPAQELALAATNTRDTVSLAFASEAGRFQEAGLSTVVCGPGSIDQAHQPDEFIAVEQLAVGVGIMRRLIAGLA